MSPKEAARVLTASVTGAGVTIYTGAVVLNAELTREISWWPYSWLAWVAAVTAVAALTWILLIDWRTSKPTSDSLALIPAAEQTPTPATTAPGREPTRAQPAPESPVPSQIISQTADSDAKSEAEPAEAPDPDPSPQVTSTPDRVTWGQMTARRMPNESWSVTWPNGEQVGSITPIGQGFFHVLHARGDDAGQHRSIEDAMRAIWEED